MRDKFGADLEVPPDLGVDDQIHIALTEAGLYVGQTVELFGQRQKGLGQQRDLGGAHGDLALLGAEDHALDAHDIAHVQLAALGEGLGAQLVHLEIELDPTGAVLEVGEDGLAHAALAHQAAGDGHALVLQRVKVGLDGLGVVGHVIPGELERILPGLLQLLQLFVSDPDLVDQGEFRLGNKLCHSASSYFSTERISNCRVPTGASTSTMSPTVLPIMALPKGESSEMRCSLGLASCEPTMA